jgi:hypothetical protein
MKIGTKLTLIGILSLLIGAAFASPLLIAELGDIRPYNEPLPKGPTADIDVNVAYANFSVGETGMSEVYNRNVTEISYFVVLNITNNSDEYATVSMINFDAAETITRGIASDSIFASENWTSSRGWKSEGAWVDGKWYNLTWVPHDSFWINCSTLIYGEDMWSEGVIKGEGYWMEGVQLKDKAVGGKLTNMYMNMNGTWVDVTGRIEWLDNDGNIVDINPELLPAHTSQAVTASGTYFGEMLTFGIDKTGSDCDLEMDPGTIAVVYAPLEFDNLWAPHQSRLISLSCTKQVLATLLDESKIEQMETEEVTFRGSVHSYLEDTAGLYDSTAVDDEIKQIRFELTEDGYIYNTILSGDQKFTTDSFELEVFLEPRN